MDGDRGPWWPFASRRRFPFWALFALLLGVAWLGREVGWWQFETRWIFPILFIAIGAAAIINWMADRR
jgi:hypothetical protein